MIIAIAHSVKAKDGARLNGATLMLSDQGVTPPDPARINDPKHWREKAEQAIALTKEMADPEAREAMLKVAEQHERLAGLAEKPERRK
jgi:hypothetical protein